MPTPPLTRELASFVADCDPAAMPRQVRDIAIAGILDSIGVMIAGRSEPAPSILKQVLTGAAAEAHIAFGDDMASAADAAWIGATAAHALDYDDVSIQGHTSAVMVPALLAEAEATNASGADLVTAYVVGFEVWADLVLREPDQHHRKGWHPTGLFGVIGAAAACARLRRLTAAQVVNALGLAASQSAGVMANFGSMAKPFHAGRAAHGGLVAARLAQAGMTASPDALEHPQGLLSAASPNGRVDLARPVAAGDGWHLLRQGLSIKKYPTCLSTHRTLDGLIALAQQHALVPEQVESVQISMSARNATILRSHRPQTGLEAKFSAEFAAASALLKQRLTLAELDDAYVAGPDVQALLPRVSLSHDSREDPATGYAPYDEIIVRLRNGDEVSTRVSAIRGSAALPLSDDELFQKFAACLHTGGSRLQARRFFDELAGIERIADMAPFVRARCGRRAVRDTIGMRE
jgi:2-methylcitrate dehydratase PrpD